MLDWNTLFAFSHTYCVAICAVLVPFNLLLTLLTLILVGMNRPQVPIVAGVAIGSSLLMVLHVLTWLWVGVVRMETFVLFSLGITCLGGNIWALGHRASLRRVVRSLIERVQSAWRLMVQRFEAL